MNFKMLRPFIVKVSVLGYFPLHIQVYHCFILLFLWSPFIPPRNLDEVFTYKM